MSISNPAFHRRTTSRRRIAAEAAVAGALASAATVLTHGADAWMPGAAIHPVWIAILLMAGAYGVRGLLVAAPVTWATHTLAAVAVGAGWGGLAARLGRADDLSMASIAIGVAGIAMVHERRRERLANRLASLARQTQCDETLLEELRDRVVRLRQRADRIEVAIPMWRDVAERLASGVPEVAAAAALELCVRRTGARAGLVRREGDGAPHNLAWSGPWSADRHTPRDIFPDRTIAAALARGAVALASDVPGATAGDSDVAVPLRSTGDGGIVGVLALRGAPASQLDAATLGDLAEAASWLATSLGAAGIDRADLPVGERPELPPPAPARVLRLIEDHP